jgi:hypothetical protein
MKVSLERFNALKEQKSRAIAKAREYGSGRGLRSGLGHLAGNAAAGAVDGYMGEGTATVIGVAAGVGGYFLKQPDLVNVGTGMLGPAVYRGVRAKVEAMKASQASA